MKKLKKSFTKGAAAAIKFEKIHLYYRGGRQSQILRYTVIKEAAGIHKFKVYTFNKGAAGKHVF